MIFLPYQKRIAYHSFNVIEVEYKFVEGPL